MIPTWLSLVVAVVVVAADGKTISLYEERIAGGENADITSYPYQVSIEYNGQHNCGGSIISPNIILSAGHCTPFAIEQQQVRAGSTIAQTGGVVVKIAKIIPHENFDSGSLVNDIALFILAESLQYSNTIQPIQLANEGDFIGEGTTATLTGWGFIDAQNTPASNLQKIELPVLNQEKCTAFYTNSNLHVTPANICVGYIGVNNKVTCAGDSGGPLVANGKQFGALSFGPTVCGNGSPSVYTRIIEHREWIRRHANV